jgi:hypothetical protein
VVLITLAFVLALYLFRGLGGAPLDEGEPAALGADAPRSRGPSGPAR